MSETDFASTYAPPAPEAAPEAPEAEAPAWSGPSQEQWATFESFMQQQAAERQAYEQQQYEQQQGAPFAELNPFDESFGGQLQQLIAAAVQQATAPLTEYQYQQQLGEAHNRALDIIEDDVSRNGEFMYGEKAYGPIEALANSYMNEEAQRHGYGPKAAEAALARASADWRAFEASVAEAGVSRHMNQLSRLGDASRDPFGAAAAASQGLRVQPGGDELDVVTGFGGFAGRP